MAKRGDIVIIENNGNLIAAVVHLNGREAITVSESGLVRLPLSTPAGKSNIVRAWSLDLASATPATK